MRVHHFFERRPFGPATHEIYISIIIKNHNNNDCPFGDLGSIRTLH